MNELTPSNANAINSIPCSPALKALLDGENSNERAVREIATNPRLRSECLERLPSLVAAATAPAGVRGVQEVVGRRLALFGVNLPPEAAEAWWSDYYDCLDDLPATALEAGMRAHIRSGAGFMPKPGELRQLALKTQNPAVRAVERARAALEWQPPKTYEPTPITITPRVIRDEPSDAEKQKVREMAAAFSAAIEAKKPAPIEAFKCKAKVDEHGLTAEMREALARRAEEGDHGHG